MLSQDPMSRAREICAQAKKSPNSTLRAAKRIRGLSHQTQLNLSVAGAPYYVYRWVADADGLAAQAKRTAFAIHIAQQRVACSHGLIGKGWLTEGKLNAALAVYRAAQQEATARGCIVPPVDAIPWEKYEAAIAGYAPRARKKRALEHGAVDGERPAEGPAPPPIQPAPRAAPVVTDNDIDRRTAAYAAPMRDALDAQDFQTVRRLSAVIASLDQTGPLATTAPAKAGAAVPWGAS
jgi:hypothetical protein